MLSYLGGPYFPLAFRRGWTHGALALIVLPPLLAAVLTGLDRLADRMRGAVIPSDVRPRQLLILSCIAVWSHPVLDTLNVYGVRWLMPFAERWFYGDVLFIVDPWLFLILGAGVWMSRRRARTRELFRTAQERPARIALGVTVAYIVLMAIASRTGAAIAGRELAALTGDAATDVMLGPVPVNPFAREVVARQGDGFVTADFRWLRSSRVDPGSLRIYPRGPWEDHRVRTATRHPEARHWLTWARFPTVSIDSTAPGPPRVHFVDLRYARAPGDRFGAITIDLPAATAAR